MKSYNKNGYVEETFDEYIESKYDELYEDLNDNFYIQMIHAMKDDTLSQFNDVYEQYIEGYDEDDTSIIEEEVDLVACAAENINDLFEEEQRKPVFFQRHKGKIAAGLGLAAATAGAAYKRGGGKFSELGKTNLSKIGKTIRGGGKLGVRDAKKAMGVGVFANKPKTNTNANTNQTTGDANSTGGTPPPAPVEQPKPDTTQTDAVPNPAPVETPKRGKKAKMWQITYSHLHQ